LHALFAWRWAERVPQIFPEPRKIRVAPAAVSSHLVCMNMLALAPDASASDTNYRRMARAIRFLSEHYLEQPTLEDAASAAGLSAFHFQRLFRRHVGISPKAFVGHLTLAHAKSELARGASVLSAALDSGLSGPSRLHDLCLKIEAMTPGDYAKGGAGLRIAHGFHESPFGLALLLVTEHGVCGLAFADEQNRLETLADMRARWPRAQYCEDNARTGRFAERIFTPGRRDELTLHLFGSRWQIKVWQALLAIPMASVVSYGALAQQVGDARAARAVGAAVGRNPIAWLIPCHRVLAGDGSLHGYHWGVARKRSMLAYEAAKAAA
jgi:AraC family transcriptional regulator of adaptative response/methylated-DNA-[protein]-cysteine methyltransferase